MTVRRFLTPSTSLACVLLATSVLLSTSVLRAQEKDSTPADENCGARVELAAIWKHLRARYDKDKDGKITPLEYPRGKQRFTNFDRDRDGNLTAKDFPEGKHFNGFSPGMLRRADRDRDGVVTKAEWKGMVGMLDADGNGKITSKEFGRIAGPAMAEKWDLMLLSFDQDLDGDFDLEDCAAMFNDCDLDSDGRIVDKELAGWKWSGPRSNRRAPKVGAIAPDFELPRLDDEEKSIRLSSFRGKRPVALIFGSYT